MKLEQGKRYVAEIALGFLEKMASNEMIADKFREVGFEDVTVTGSGSSREATGTWPFAARDVSMPKQVKQAWPVD